MNPWVPLAGAGQDGAPQLWVGAPHGYTVPGVLCSLEVVPEPHPFPSHPFPSLVAPATTPGGYRTPHQGYPATSMGSGDGGCDAPVTKVLGCSSRQSATHATSCPSRHPQPVSRHQGGVTAAAGSRHRPPLVTLPRAHLLSGASSPRRGGRAAGSIRRKINSRLSGRHRPHPSSPLLLPRRHWARPRGPRHGRAEDRQLVTPPAASHRDIRQGLGTRPGLSSVQSRDASGGDMGQWCQPGTVCPQGRQQRAPVLCQDQIRGLSWAAPGDQIRALLFLYSRKGKKNKKEERKKIHFMFFQPPAFSLTSAQPRPGWFNDGSLGAWGLEGRDSWVFGSRSKALGREQGCQAEPGWLQWHRMPHGTGSATPASQHPAVSPWHLCNELAGLSLGQE